MWIRSLWWSLAAVACLPALAQSQADNYGQFAPPDAFENGSKFAYYGSENEWSRRQFEASKVAEQPNRLGQRLVLAIQDGKPELAAQWAQEYLAKDPQQQEALFALSVAQAQLGDVQQANKTVEQALKSGLPFERFIAGPRELLAPLTSSRDFQKHSAAHPIQLIHGPMLGAMTDTSVQIWVRTANESNVEVRAYRQQRSDQEDSPIATATARSSKAMDYTAVAKVSGLTPHTPYAYEVIVDGHKIIHDPQPTFRTFPPDGARGKVKVAFGGCAAYVPENERMWETIAKSKPRALLMLGDNVYIDLAEQASALHRYTYYQRQSRPEFRRLVSTVPVFSIWDDHDAAIDDVWFGPFRDRPSWKPSMLQLQKENWNNPAYGEKDWPGCWFRFSVGNVDFFMLDCRYYRTNPFAAEKTMLGPVQKKWLLSGLKKSKAAFKVVAASVAWAEGAKPGSRDTWDGFPDEREEIFRTIESNKIGGVVLLSGDRHRSDARKISRPNGAAFYDFMSSRLTNQHTHELIPGALFDYNEKCSFGLLTFETARDDPQVTYEIIDIDGKSVHSLTLKGDQISPSTPPEN